MSIQNKIKLYNIKKIINKNANSYKPNQKNKNKTLKY